QMELIMETYEKSVAEPEDTMTDQEVQVIPVQESCALPAACAKATPRDPGACVHPETTLLEISISGCAEGVEKGTDGAVCCADDGEQEAGLGWRWQGRQDTKYGTYTALEVPSNVIIDIQQVQSNECGGSYHMELEGLRRSVAAVEEEGLSIGTIITDRHRQIAKWIRTELPEVQHLYDIWHVAKGISRKLESLAKQKECDAIKPWKRSVVNHLYWSAVSTESGHGDLVAEKWMSVINHIQNVHEGHGDLVTLAAMHYNENAGRPQAETKEGKLRFKIRYPKFKKGGYTVCKVNPHM
ncbi:hypothetical protein JOQ06_026632, partial [Pogonophryne albipinna]